MRAARFHGPGLLHVEEVPRPEIGPGEVLLRVAGSGVCRSDIRVIEGDEDPVALYGAHLPITLGHENAGFVESVGVGVESLRPGDPVAVYGAWGCGVCRVCRSGEEQQCDIRRWVGVGRDGGYADYLRVPAARHLRPLRGLDPVEAATLVDAGVTSYRAVRRTLPALRPGSALVIIGVGGLGHLAVQIAKAIAPTASLIAVDVSEDRLELAQQLGADHVLDGREDVSSAIRRLTDGEGAGAVVDFVGSEQTLRTSDAVIGRNGLIILTGGSGGALRYAWHFTEASITSTTWGSPADLDDVLQLARSNAIHPHVSRFPLEAINDAFSQLADGRILGLAVVTPNP